MQSIVELAGIFIGELRFGNVDDEVHADELENVLPVDDPLIDHDYVLIVEPQTMSVIGWKR